MKKLVFQLYATKTEEMIISRGRIVKNILNYTNLHGHKIQTAQRVRFFGMTLDR